MRKTQAKLATQPRVPAGRRSGGQYSTSLSPTDYDRTQFENPYMPSSVDDADEYEGVFENDEWMLEEHAGFLSSLSDEPWDEEGEVGSTTSGYWQASLPLRPPTVSPKQRAIRENRVVRVPTGPQGSGDGYVYTPDGKQYWGLYGAAGLLVRSPHPSGGFQYFLAKRSQALSGGAGTWAMPGGAIDEAESPVAGALREFREETGFTPTRGNIVRIIEDPVVPGEWTYTTVIVEVSQPFQAPKLTPDSWETDAVDWVHADDIRRMGEKNQLHPGMATRLQELLAD